MPEIRLSCVVIPSNFPVEKITRQHVVTIDIDKKESVYSLRSKIKKEHTPGFDDITITEFVIRAVEYSSNDLEKANVTALFLSIKNGVSQRTELSPISNIFDHFPEQPSKKDNHIIVYLDIQTRNVMR